MTDKVVGQRAKLKHWEDCCNIPKEELDKILLQYMNEQIDAKAEEKFMFVTSAHPRLPHDGENNKNDRQND